MNNQKKTLNYVDGYLQMRINLTQGQIEQLEKEGKITERVCRINDGWKEFPLRMYLCKEDIPQEEELGKDFEDSHEWGFEIYISRRRLELIRAGKMADGISPRTWLRQVCISLDNII